MSSPTRSPVWADRHQMGPMGVPPSPDVVLTEYDGTQVRVPSALFRTCCSPTGATPAAAKPKPPPQHLFLFDSGWAGVCLAVTLGKENVVCIVHIKKSFGGFPKEDLEEKLRGMPAGSFLELETAIDNVP